jgi:uncharacterized membrane protein
MTGTHDDNDAGHTRGEEPARDPGELFGLDGPGRRVALSWFDEHLPEMRRAAFGDRLLYQAIVVCLVVGLLAHVGGYLLRASASTDLVGLLGDLLYALGYALWTGAVIVTLLDVVPKVKQRQFREALQAYEQAKREAADQARAEREEASSAGDEPTSRERRARPENRPRETR